jgi:beta-glucosidase
MRNSYIFLIGLLFYSIISCTSNEQANMKSDKFKPYKPPVSYKDAELKAEQILTHFSLEEKINFIGGHNFFFIQGSDSFHIPQLYLSDATQGVHIRKDLDGQLEKSTAFPCPISLAATWNTDLAGKYAKAIGEECRAGDIAVLLGPGMNLYRISQNGRNFEYFGEDPYLASRMIENYVVGVQSTGTIATLKHFIANNTDYRRRTSNSIVDERALHELYLPAFKAGIDAGAMAVMTSYNQVNGEWAGQSSYVISNLLRKQLGYKWLVMSDWWSIWDPEKAIKSGQDLDMPGHGIKNNEYLDQIGDPFLRTNAKRLLDEGKVSEDDIHRMAKHVLMVSIAMGLDKRPVKDTSYLKKFPEHKEVALQTAREGIVLLRNEDNILPISKSGDNSILLTGQFVEEIPKGGGSAEVEGYDHVNMLSALKAEFGDKVQYIHEPKAVDYKKASIVLVSIGTLDNEGMDSPFELDENTVNLVNQAVSGSDKVIVIVNAGRGVKMSGWSEKVQGIVYSWYPGQTGYVALAEILSGKTNPSAKLPISIEKKFEDSPGYPYIPNGEALYTDWKTDVNMKLPIYDIVYDEGVLVGYRWYEKKKIEPLYPFGFGLSYTNFEYSGIKVSQNTVAPGDTIHVEFTVKNTGGYRGAEIAQLYVQDSESSVLRPVKELKGFRKIWLAPGEAKVVQIPVNYKDLAFWDKNSGVWKTEPGEFNLLIASSSDNIRLTEKIMAR